VWRKQAASMISAGPRLADALAPAKVAKSFITNRERPRFRLFR
jgi:hypothetical protein